MLDRCRRRVAVLSLLCLGLGTNVSNAGPDASPQGREQIGEVLGQPVYRDQVRRGFGIKLRSELARLFLSPVVAKFREAHKADIEPTEEEIETATRFFDEEHLERIREKETRLGKRLETIEDRLAGGGLSDEQTRELRSEQSLLEAQLQAPGRPFATYMVSHWKFEKYLYDHYGEGRILWQQAGLEAFDATRKFLESLEQSGEFKITDESLRSTLYEYWTTMDHGSFLIRDKARIREEFLEPAWLPASTTE